MKLPVKPSMEITTTRVTIVDSAQILVAECQNEKVAETISNSLNNYDALKSSHDKLVERLGKTTQYLKIRRKPTKSKYTIPSYQDKIIEANEQALKEAGKL